MCSNSCTTPFLLARKPALCSPLRRWRAAHKLRLRIQEKGRSLLSEREVQFFDALAFGGLAAAVVARGGNDGGVAGELLRGREIHAGVEQVGDEAAA